MIGLALEGGGARGAFQMGVLKAFLEEGYEFNGVTGTSIGAINGAILAQGSFEEGYEFWERAIPSLFFNVEEEAFKRLIDSDSNRDNIIRFAIKLKNIIRNKGVDTSKIRLVLEDIIDEDKLRKSKTLFGLVTVSLSDFKPYELYKEDIPAGRIIDYLIASATLPGFKLTEIENRRFIDGGIYNNCPINLLARKGFKKIIAIRTLAPGIIKNVKDSDLDITYIKPSESLGRILDFNNNLIKRNMKMGYYDARRQIQGLLGNKYCIIPFDEDLIYHALYMMDDNTILELGELFGFYNMNPRRMLFELIIPESASKLGLKGNASYREIVIELFELLAGEMGVSKYKIYTLSDLTEEIKLKIDSFKDIKGSGETKISLKILDNLSKRPVLIKVAEKVLTQLSQCVKPP